MAAASCSGIVRGEASNEDDNGLGDAASVPAPPSAIGTSGAMSGESTDATHVDELLNAAGNSNGGAPNDGGHSRRDADRASDGGAFTIVVPDSCTLDSMTVTPSELSPTDGCRGVYRCDGDEITVECDGENDGTFTSLCSCEGSGSYWGLGVLVAGEGPESCQAGIAECLETAPPTGCVLAGGSYYAVGSAPRKGCDATYECSGEDVSIQCDGESPETRCQCSAGGDTWEIRLPYDDRDHPCYPGIRECLAARP